VNRLMLSACAAALLHAFLFLVPLPTASVTPPSAPTHGTTISVSMTVPSVQSAVPPKAVAKPKPQKTPPKKIKPVPSKKPPVQKKKTQAKRIKPKKAAKKKVPVLEPVEELPTPAPPVAAEDPEPSPTPDEPSAPVEVAMAKETDQESQETVEPASAPAVGGTLTDAQPTSVYAPEPRYPKAAIRRGYQGVVLLDILVAGDGHVEKVKLKTSSGHGVLDRSALKGVKKWRFSASGSTQPTWVTLPVRFELRGM